MSKMQSAQRVSQVDASDNFVYQRSVLAYHKAAEIVSGSVLEIGTGSGYGIEIISPRVECFRTIDKFNCQKDLTNYPNVEFHRMKVPPLKNITSSSIDYVITFQVIEHIHNDFALLREIRRVLKPHGKLIITTPNIKMSLTRNPWHVREYTPNQFKNLLSVSFHEIEALGVFGNEKIMGYYDKNRQAVKRIERLDIFRLMRWLPRWVLRIPYDIANRLNRRKLLDQNQELTEGIEMSDYYLAPVANDCFDLFYIAQK